MLASALLPTASGCNHGVGTSVFGGQLSNLAVGNVLMVPAPDHNLNICRDESGVFAIDGNCTHAHCVLLFMDPTNPSGFTCPCHGSTFDYDGENPTGPAAQTGPLDHYQVTISGDEIFVDYGIIVDPSVRVKP